MISNQLRAPLEVVGGFRSPSEEKDMCIRMGRPS